MKNPLVSIITPVYNCGILIFETFKSLESQTYKNIEWILVDDASDEKETKIYLDRIKQKAQFPVRLIRNTTNRRQAYSKNIGFNHSVGEYVRFLDADDLMENSLIEKQINKALESDSKEYIVVSPTKNFIERQNGESQFWTNELYKSCNFENDLISIFLTTPLFSHCGCLYPRVTIQRIQGFVEDLYTDEDGWFLLKLMLNGAEFKMIDDTYYLYRQHQLTSRVSVNDNPRKWHDRFRVCLLFENEAKRLGVIDNYKYQLAQRIDLIASEYFTINQQEAEDMFTKARLIAPNYLPKQGLSYYFFRRLLGRRITGKILKLYRYAKFSLSKSLS
ncbi:MAG: glycosyltransferase family 2 protein [Bacteroidia bacterium]